MLVEGDDHDEPVADACRGILDGHIVLERSIAERGRYPAINVLRSLSRTMPNCNTEQQTDMIRVARQNMSVYDDMAELIRLGAYRRGTDPTVDRAIELRPALEKFLSQRKDERSDLESGYVELAAIVNMPYAGAAGCRAGCDPKRGRPMSGLEQMLRLQKWTLDEKRRQATDLEALIDRLRGDVRRLDDEVASEVEVARNDIELQRVLPDYKRGDGGAPGADREVDCRPDRRTGKAPRADHGILRRTEENRADHRQPGATATCRSAPPGAEPRRRSRVAGSSPKKDTTL